MDNSLIKQNKVRKTRTLRVRKKLRGTNNKPRLSVIKTNKHIHVQLIDDESGKTIAATSTIAKDFRSAEFNRKNKAAGKELGLKIGELAKRKDIKNVVFDRGASKYHGVVAAVADGAREQGLEF